jgi:hypothetical protein
MQTRRAARVAADEAAALESASAHAVLFSEDRGASRMWLDPDAKAALRVVGTGMRSLVDGAVEVVSPGAGASANAGLLSCAGLPSET